jgi:hypothetical protein
MSRRMCDGEPRGEHAGGGTADGRGEARGTDAIIGMSSGRRVLGQFEKGDFGWGVEADGGEGGADAAADV